MLRFHDEIKEIDHIIKIAISLPFSWFRGHSTDVGELTPKIFRPKFQSLSPILPNYELSFIEDFKERAHQFLTDPPPWDNNMQWLFLMQHHGCPTRLLDWTKSALVALYFSVSDFDNTKEDGELWVMDPYELNGTSGNKSFPTYDSEFLRYMVDEALYKNEELRKRYLGRLIPPSPLKPLAFTPPLFYERMIYQMSTFTIHPKLEKNKSITDVLDDNGCLVRYLVKSKNKDTLRNNLKSLGITHHTLFPDLDHLSLSIIEDQFNEENYQLVVPPKFVS